MNKEYFLNSIFTTLEERNVDYFVYGTYENLPHSTGDSDLDMYINESDMCVFIECVSNLLNTNNVILASYFEGSTFMMFRFIAKDWGVQIDVTNSVFSYKGIVYYPITYLRNRIIYYNGIRVLDISKGYFVDFLKEIIHNGKAKDKYINAFVEEIKANTSLYEKEIGYLYGEEVKNLILNNLSPQLLKEKSRSLCIMIRKSVTKGNKLKLIIYKLSLFKRFFQRKPGYLIAVEGTDGSGKSYIINHITPILNEGFHNGVVYNHLRPNVIPDLGVLLGKKKKSEGETVVANPHGNNKTSFFQSIIRWSYYMIDYTFGYMKSVWPLIHTRSKVFLFDRYYYDYYIDPQRSSTNLPHWMLRIGELFVPIPDLILCLGGDPERIYKRKPETSLEEVTRQTNELNNFCKSHKNTVWIDTTISPNESVEAAMTAIVEMMSKRFKNVNR